MHLFPAALSLIKIRPSLETYESLSISIVDCNIEGNNQADKLRVVKETTKRTPDPLHRVLSQSNQTVQKLNPKEATGMEKPAEEW